MNERILVLLRHPSQFVLESGVTVTSNQMNVREGTHSLRLFTPTLLIAPQKVAELTIVLCLLLLNRKNIAESFLELYQVLCHFFLLNHELFDILGKDGHISFLIVLNDGQCSAISRQHLRQIFFILVVHKLCHVALGS